MRQEAFVMTLDLLKQQIRNPGPYPTALSLVIHPEVAASLGDDVLITTDFGDGCAIGVVCGHYARIDRSYPPRNSQGEMTVVVLGWPKTPVED